MITDKFAPSEQPVLPDGSKEHRNHLRRLQDRHFYDLEKIALASRVLIVEGISGSGKDIFQKYLKNPGIKYRSAVPLPSIYPSDGVRDRHLDTDPDLHFCNCRGGAPWRAGGRAADLGVRPTKCQTDSTTRPSNTLSTAC